MQRHLELRYFEYQHSIKSSFCYNRKFYCLHTVLNRIEIVVGNTKRSMGFARVSVGTLLPLIVRVANIPVPFFARLVIEVQTIMNDTQY
jgi:hypothetical protein